MIKKISENLKIGIWNITETPVGIASSLFLNKYDLNVLSSFTNDKRKVEWLAARVLINELTNENCAIEYSEFHKPFIIDSKNKISISHSRDYVAVALNTLSETGIDIEEIHPKIQNIASKFMSDAELAALPLNNFIEPMLVYWCAKEALYKLYGDKNLVFAENLSIQPFKYNPEKGKIKACICNEKFNREYILVYEKINNYLMAYVLE
ncbi:MAG: 4'-phosphopantetheinyl transferase superfamily protein [Bacteroidia bacterium]